MDTPHVSQPTCVDVARRVGSGNDAVLGPADDGGWWVLALHRRPARAWRRLAGVEMSTDHTYADTLAALRAARVRVVAGAATLRDVDTVQDAAGGGAGRPAHQLRPPVGVGRPGPSPSSSGGGVSGLGSNTCSG